MSQDIFKPFENFAPSIRAQSPLRQAITASYRVPETQLVPMLLKAADIEPPLNAKIEELSRQLIQALRNKPAEQGIKALIQEYSLSSQEGVALMCLAEALLRIPDAATRDALIRDKVADGNWIAHLNSERSLFVNAATWGLVVTGKLASTVKDENLAKTLTGVLARLGEPVVRRGVDFAMRLMGEQFVTGETIDAALRRAVIMEKKGFQYSYDMLGEAASTAEDAARYFKSYETAIEAIGRASQGRGVCFGPGISIKLSALHPRYTRAQAARVMNELLPRVASLAERAKRYGIGLNIDAEEADRLELSLDIMEALAFDEKLANWDGLGFVVQAYGKRCTGVIDYLIDLARRSGRRLMIRLVKGAYWDSEIKRAQVDGQTDFPVFTRKFHTDVAYIACAKKMLAAGAHVFPQFATHNARTLATIYHLAGSDFEPGQYEFQCLHGMGEPLYEQVVGPEKLNRPCRIYAPVGTHETLLAYLVRRLLENGANSSFVNQISNPDISIEKLIEDPAAVTTASAVIGQGHGSIAHPSRIYGKARTNSSGLDLSDETTLAALGKELAKAAIKKYHAHPLIPEGYINGPAKPVINPADHRDVVGDVMELEAKAVSDITGYAQAKTGLWASRAIDERAACLDRAADMLEQRMMPLISLLIREAGKSTANAIGEVREAVDFLRYYSVQARSTLDLATPPLGVVVCISPWNFPLAIFIGQIAAALVAGNTVIAKPATPTPLIAFEAVTILHAAGIPEDALLFAPGGAETGAALVASPHVSGVMFTGSTGVARIIQAELSKRLLSENRPVPFIAETGGLNAMIVDSSALTEQVVSDVIASAFDSAGQRCSALRLLCLQEDVADRTLEMLKGALNELSIGSTDKLCTDIGPVITEAAKQTIEFHIKSMRDTGYAVHTRPLPENCMNGTFLAPTIIELQSVSDLKTEVFGPVLHVVRFERKDMGDIIESVNASGYGLTFGLHTRLDTVVSEITNRVKAGNLYINRNTIGAVVGVQPFGGRGLSGTGPKAGGPLYLERLVEVAPMKLASEQNGSDLDVFIKWLEETKADDVTTVIRALSSSNPLGFSADLVGPVGEHNSYAVHRRGRILLFPESQRGLLIQIGAVLATGNTAVIALFNDVEAIVKKLPAQIRAKIDVASDWESQGPFAGALIEGDVDRTIELNRQIASLPGPLVTVQASGKQQILRDKQPYCLNWLVEEVSISVNTTAAGGNASLMTLST